LFGLLKIWIGRRVTLKHSIPYGTLNANQLKQLAYIADKYDRGYGHITTRQNIQYNWPELTDVPDILQDLADVEMHAFQTSGNCIRNVTSDPYAGAAADEVEDPRVTAELLRQWSTIHPEFAFLPRKFKIAVTASKKDRAVIKAHDIGIEVLRNEAGEVGYRIIVGGGLGRTPIIGVTLKDFLPREELLPYLEAVMRVYNRYGRRDNKYKARIKILVKETGLEKFKEEVEAEYETLESSDIAVSGEEIERIRAYFAPPNFEVLDESESPIVDHDFKEWVKVNTHPHKQIGYKIVNISLKPIDRAPGDITSEQMRSVALMAEKYSFGEVRTTHQQNLVLPHVKTSDLWALYQELKQAKLADANIGLITDIICCPGMDFCALATARSIPVSQAISERFADPVKQRTIGEMQIKISGCINACGHHHVGHIGILGLEKAGVEFYQVKLGGDATETASIGDVTGPGFSQTELVDAIERMVDFYLDNRLEDERFIDAYRRLGIKIIADGPLIPDQYSMALQCGFDAVRVDAQTFSRQAESHWFDAMDAFKSSYQRGYTIKNGPATSVFDARKTSVKFEGSNDPYFGLSAEKALEKALKEYDGKIVLASSLGVDSVVLLHMVAQLDRNLPILFLDTGKHFRETLSYRDLIIEDLGLTDFRNIRPDVKAVKTEDPDGELYRETPDACCDLRKVRPLDGAISKFEARITGRKRYQTRDRANMPILETGGRQVKVNPLAYWHAKDVTAYMRKHDLPSHPMLSLGFLSVGCQPCTTRVAEGEDPRAGRWRNSEKTECGIHYIDGKWVSVERKKSFEVF